MAAAVAEPTEVPEGGGEVPKLADFQTEEQIVELWDNLNAFQKQLDLTKDYPKYTFYDGPPFATGLPHYGHIVASTMKDIVPRYWAMNGRSVERRFGWDTHGLPIEFEIEKEKNIKTREEVMAFGVANYNEACRDIVLRYAAEWRKTISRLGRWVDFDNDYKTMDVEYMETLWWVHRQLYDKGLVYKGVKVMPYSTSCTTPLSNFEAALNYKEDTKDPSVTVKFTVKDESRDALLGALGAAAVEGPIHILAWTTTPWTLPSNLAACVHPTMVYNIIRAKPPGAEKSTSGEKKDKKKKKKDAPEGGAAGEAAAPEAPAEEIPHEYYIMAEPAVARYYPDPTHYTVLGKCPGAQLQGTRYTPLFDFYQQEFGEDAFKVVVDGYVTSEEGTGVVHQAPGFGADDMRVCTANDIVSRTRLPPCPMDPNGRFTDPITTWSGVYFKDADPLIMRNLKERKLVAQSGVKLHTYPYCWRSDTPLMYRTVSCWFIDVPSIKAKLIANNNKTHWVPGHVKDGRFASWLENVVDWCYSRNRYWGTPVPIWVSDDGEERVCIGSIAELEERAKLPKGTITDLHSHKIDHITFESTEGRGTLRRIPEVFDCWFESGAMPYAQCHYPFAFENPDDFKKAFPADFIAEGVDQTRGWFYTLMVLSTALFDEPAFINNIVNGIVLASDGKKMSKRLKNYPPPEGILADYGADALRLYLMSSPVVRAESLRFRDADVKEVVREVHMMFFNSGRFFLQMAELYEKTAGKPLEVFDIMQLDDPAAVITDPIDNWVLQCLQDFTSNIHQDMEKYILYHAGDHIRQFIDQLSRWYIKLNKTRFKAYTAADCPAAAVSLSVLCNCLYYMSLAMAPFTPFLSERMHQRIMTFMPGDRPASVHFLQMHKTVWQASSGLLLPMKYLRDVINLARKMRQAEKKIAMWMPVNKMIVIHKSPDVLAGLEPLKKYIQSDLNLMELEFAHEEEKYVEYHIALNPRVAGKKFGKAVQSMLKAAKDVPPADVKRMMDNGTPVDVCGNQVTMEDCTIERAVNPAYKTFGYENEGDISILMDSESTEEMMYRYQGRVLTRQLQQFRKELELVPSQFLNVYYSFPEGTSDQVQQQLVSLVTVYEKDYLLAANLELRPHADGCNVFASKAVTVFDTQIVIHFEHRPEA